MRVDYFMDRVLYLHLEATCQGDGHRIEKIIENDSVRFSYAKAKRLIKEYCKEVYDSLAMNYYNPWENDTWRSRDGKYIIITHSSIEYLFRTNL